MEQSLVRKSVVDTVTVEELDCAKFFIPKYQRGYRWDREQVEELLDDIERFEGRDGEFYCLQPLVVKAGDKFEVIDGQQRLTTIFILQRMLHKQNKSPFALEYATRSDSWDYLSGNDFCGDQSIEEKNIDYYHISNARNVIRKWMAEKNDDARNAFLEKLRKHTRFIWYAPEEDDAESTFTRLNVDKIPLTDAELIRSLLLKDADSGEERDIRALEWDRIETTLKNDEFWLFFQSITYKSETRIDYLFELLLDMHRLGVLRDIVEDDKHKSFHYVTDYLDSKGSRNRKEQRAAATKVWNEVLLVFNALKNWYEDIELYHYIGYLVAIQHDDKQVHGIVKKALRVWLSSCCAKKAFVGFLKKKIKKSLKGCDDLKKNYFVDSDRKRDCVPLLLLFNVETIVRQSKQLKENAAYAMPISQRFPFHLYKREKWDVEHIASATDNESRGRNDQIEWVKQHIAVVGEGNEYRELRKDAYNFCTEYDNCKVQFEDLSKQLSSMFNPVRSLEEEFKNMVGNFALLDRGTNRGYHNDHFPVKRRKIGAKERGQIIAIDFDKDENDIPKFCARNECAPANTIPFVPVCTKNVFLKFYTPLVDCLDEWDKTDFDCYTKAIFETLESFGVKL